MYQIAEIGAHRQLSPTNLASQRWQTEVASHLGDSATELRATSPSQMTLVRKSSIGLTAFELVTIAFARPNASFSTNICDEDLIPPVSLFDAIRTETPTKVAAAIPNTFV